MLTRVEGKGRALAVLLGVLGASAIVATVAWSVAILTDPAGHRWDFDDQGPGTPPAACGSGYVSEGSSDAYDVFGFLCVTTDGAALATKCAASDVYCGVVAPAAELSGRQFALGLDTLRGLEVQRRLYVPSSGPTDANSFLRYFDSFHNPTGSAITVQIRLGSASPGLSNLGSDSATACRATSDGDTTVEPTDLWITTDDSSTTGGDPSLGFVVQGAGAAEAADFFSLNPFTGGSVDELMWAFDHVTIPAGGTVALMTFFIQDSDQTRAQAEAAYLVLGSSEATSGLTGTQMTWIRNFTFCHDCDSDGYDLLAGDCDDWDDTVHPGVTTDPCDGKDNDCDLSTEDGSSETWYGVPCDGPDPDGCTDGIEVCVDGARACNDEDGLSPELCDGLDNDCDSSTADGSGDPLVGVECDGDDPDLCAEGVLSCVSGALSCSDTMDETPELCDHVDNDCDPSTGDGTGEEWYGAPCDGSDSDMCEEGTYGCISGSQRCSDTTDSIDDVCDGADNDCNPDSPDGEDEDWYEDPCDGSDTDLCSEGVYQCAGSVQTCNDLSADNYELCNGVDDDCNPATLEGSDNDGDGISACGGDCNDGDPAIHPGAEEVCDGIDNDCNPTTDHDGDGDTVRDCEGDCAPMNPNIFPGAVEDCGNGLDDDCNDLIDGADPLCGAASGDEAGCSCSIPGADPGGALVIVVVAALLAISRRKRNLPIL